MASDNGEEFGRNQLVKYGWKEGKGLGKHENGIAKAIKPLLKFDTTGVGYDSGKEFSYHWWDHIFNSAAKNITVEKSKNGVVVRSSGNTALSSTKSKQSKEFRLYGAFVKSGVLNGTELKCAQTDTGSDHEDDITLSSRLSAEELFKACGGCTAHKAARHGHRLSGKLRRLEEQEMKLVNPEKLCPDEDIAVSSQKIKLKRKKLHPKEECDVKFKKSKLCKS